LHSTDAQLPTRHRWLRFAIGLSLLGGVIILGVAGVTPRGAAGEIIRQDQDSSIDATPLFYSEVENMAELETRLEEWWMTGSSKRDPVQ